MYLRSTEGSPPAVRVPEIPISNLSPPNWLPWLRRFSVFLRQSNTITGHYVTAGQHKPTNFLQAAEQDYTAWHRKQNAESNQEMKLPRGFTLTWFRYILIRAKFQVLTAVLLELSVFWGVTPCLHNPDDSIRHSQCIVGLLTATAAPFWTCQRALVCSDSCYGE